MSAIKITRDLYKASNEYATGYAVRRGSGWVSFSETADGYSVATDGLAYQTTSLREAAQYAHDFGARYSRTLKAALADYN